MEVLEISLLLKFIEEKLGIKFGKYNNEFYFITKEGKIIFFIGYKSINDIYRFIDTLDMEDFYNKFNVYLSENDKKTHINFKSFLWDLYVVAINCGDSNSISEEEKFSIEKDRYVARKLVIDVINNEIISKIRIDESNNKISIKDLNEIDKKALNELIEKTSLIIEPQKLLDSYVAENEELEDDINLYIEELMKDDEMKKRIEAVNENKEVSLKEMIINYLEYIKDIHNYLDKED